MSKHYIFLFTFFLSFFFLSQTQSKIFEKGGIKVIYVENHDLNYAVFNFIFRTGSYFDPEGKEGLAYITAKMLLRGTKKRTQKQIAEEVDYLGSVLETSATKESLYIVGDAITKNIESFLEIVEDVIKNPTFPEAEFEKERNLIIEEIKNIRNDDDALANLMFSRFLLKGHPYGRPTKGTIESLNNIKKEDCEWFHKKYFVKENLLIGISGDLTPQEVEKYIIKRFETLSSSEKAEYNIPSPPKWNGMRVLLVDKPERTQTQIYIGETSISAKHPDYFPLLVGNTILGGTFTSKLMREIREKRGWSYGAYSIFHAGRRFGSFIIRFFPASSDTLEAIKLSLSMLEEFVTKGPTEDEIEFAKNYLINNFPFKIDTPQKKLNELISIELLEKQKDFLDTYIENVKKVTSYEIKEALIKNIDFKNLTIVMVCTAKEFVDVFKEWKDLLELQVHPYDKDY